MPHPLVIWSLALVALSLGLHGRARGRRRVRPTATEPAMLRLGRRLPAPASLVARVPLRRSEDALAVAGLPPEVDGAAVAAARVGWATAAAVLGAPLVLAGPAGIAVSVLACATAYQLPLRWLVAVARRRRAAIVRELPDLLDLVVICTRSGLALEPALRLAAERLPGPLSEELGRTLRELDLGTPRREAYAGLARRVDAAALTGFIGAILQADELGAPMAGVLARQAELLRAARRQDIREHAARAAPRVQLVVAMVMVPAVLLVVIGVLVIQLIGQIGGVAGGVA